MPVKTHTGFNLKQIEEALHTFRSHFREINSTLMMSREDFTPLMVGQLLEAYDFANHLWKNDINLFSPSGLYHMLELNHIVLCGTDKRKRLEYFAHLQETRTKFQKNIKPILEWYKKKHAKHPPYRLAAGYYTRALSHPQLFVEGNHRTENIIINYFLLGEGLSPYVISRETAVEYLNLSGMIKFSYKGEWVSDIKRGKYETIFGIFFKTTATGSLWRSREYELYKLIPGAVYPAPAGSRRAWNLPLRHADHERRYTQALGKPTAAACPGGHGNSTSGNPHRFRGNGGHTVILGHDGRAGIHGQRRTDRSAPVHRSRYGRQYRNHPYRLDNLISGLQL